MMQIERKKGYDMRQTQKMMMNTGVILIAYAYAIQGNSAAAAAMGALAVVCAVYSHSLRCVTDHIIWILMLVLTQLCILFFSGLLQMMPVLGFLALCNTLSASAWMHSSYKAVKECGRIILVLMLMDLCLLFILPSGVIRYFADSSAAVLSQTVLFVLMMFMPLCMSFLYRWLRHCSAVRFFSKTNA